MDPEALEAFKAFTHGFAPMKTQLQDWDMFDDLLYYKGKLVIPNDVELRCSLTEKAHDQSGHNRHYSTLNWLQDLYWWPNMTHFIHAYVDGCITCQQAKVNMHPTQPGLLPLDTAQRPFQFISMDFIMDLPPVKGYDSVLTVVDQGLSKAIHFIPCHKNTNSAKLVNLLIAHVFSWFGLPNHI